MRFGIGAFSFLPRSLIACMRVCVSIAFSINDESDVIKIGFFRRCCAGLIPDLLFFFLSLSLDQERIPSWDSSSSKFEHVRYPVKPRTMAQAQLPPEESSLDITSDADVTLVAQCKTISFSYANDYLSI